MLIGIINLSGATEWIAGDPGIDPLKFFPAYDLSHGVTRLQSEATGAGWVHSKRRDRGNASAQISFSTAVAFDSEVEAEMHWLTMDGYHHWEGEAVFYLPKVDGSGGFIEMRGKNAVLSTGPATVTGVLVRKQYVLKCDPPTIKPTPLETENEVPYLDESGQPILTDPE